jgi:hypothetical protein
LAIGVIQSGFSNEATIAIKKSFITLAKDNSFQHFFLQSLPDFKFFKKKNCEK